MLSALVAFWRGKGCECHASSAIFRPEAGPKQWQHLVRMASDRVEDIVGLVLDASKRGDRIVWSQRGRSATTVDSRLCIGTDDGNLEDDQTRDTTMKSLGASTYRLLLVEWKGVILVLQKHDGLPATPIPS